MIRTNKGFTLIELMVVIVIIGILAALAIPKFMDAATKAKFSEVPTVMASYDHAQLAYVAETGRVTTSDSLVFDADSSSKWFSYDGATTPGTNVAATKVVVGPLDAEVSIAQTVVGTDGVVTHSMHADGASARKYFNNFLP